MNVGPRASWTSAYNTTVLPWRAYYRGRILENYANTWKCPHEHATAKEARQCAEAELARRKTAT
jgi:hypothetical protein